MNASESSLSATLVLASGSPRRMELLRNLGIVPFRFPTDIDETPQPGESSAALVERLARGKAEAGWLARNQLEIDPDELVVVLAADTVVDIHGETLGKPDSAADAKKMLLKLSGADHKVFTGTAVKVGDDLFSTVTQTTVRFRSLEPEDISWYVATEEPMDKAGAYGIQGKGSIFVEGIIGSYDNVVGLPVVSVDRLLRQAGLSIPQLASAIGDQLVPPVGLVDLSPTPDVPVSLDLIAPVANDGEATSEVAAP